MNTGNWELEMNHLMEIFERESTLSLRKISRCFTAINRPFNEDFHQYLLKISNLRLDISFNRVLLERLNEGQTQSSSSAVSANVSTNGNEILSGGAIIAISNKSSCITTATKATLFSANYFGQFFFTSILFSTTEDNVGALNVPEAANATSLKIETNADDRNEIFDSDKDSDDDEGHFEIPADDGIIGIENQPEHIDAESNSGHGVKVDVKHEIKAESEIGMEDLPFDEFDPTNVNETSRDGNDLASDADSLSDQGQASSPFSAQIQLKSNAAKRFKCKDCAFATRANFELQRHLLIHQGVKPFKCQLCDYTARQKGNLIRHQRVHEHEKLMGIVRDSNDGLFKCTHCDQRFVRWNNLSSHLKSTHKNNQRLFNCMHCMRPFTQRTEKERHEILCQNRRYECYLCKNYVKRDVGKMQIHMATHSGARPFQCTVCNKTYRQKKSLRYHLQQFHSNT